MSSPTLHFDSAHAATKPANRIVYPALDGLRAVALIMVFLQHYLFLPWCLMGVNVFFVLSGFLITGILIDTRNSPHRARNFYMRRTLRIFPLYYGICLAVAVANPLFHWQWSWAWVAWPLYLANFLPYISPLAAVPQSSLHLASFGVLHTLRPVDMTLSLGHFWSLCVEEQFYLFWPWVVFSVRSRRTLLVICLSTVVAIPFMRLAAHHYAPSWMLTQDLLFRATPFQLDALVWGGLIAVMWRVERWRGWLLTAGRVLAISCLIIAVGYFALNIHPRSGGDWRHTYAYPIWSRTWGLVFVDVFSVGAILSCLRPSRLLIKTLGAAPIRWVGRISYGAYVFHDIFHEPVSRISWHISGHYLHYLEPYDEYVTALLGLGLTFLLAWMSYRYFETPFLKLKDKFKTDPV